MKTEAEVRRHVVELITGNKLSGNCALTKTELGCTIFGFDGFFLIPADQQPVYLLTEKNEIVSLFHNLESHPGSNSKLSDPPRTVYRQEITSNFALLGYENWHSDSLVKSVSFNVLSASGILRHNERYRAFMNSDISDVDVTYFRHELPDYSISIYHQGSYGMYRNHPNDDHFTIYLEYNSERTVDTFYLDMRNFVDFLCFSASSVFIESDVVISKFTSAEKESIRSSEGNYNDFDVYYLKDDKESESYYRKASQDLIFLRNDDELNTFKKCLTRWIEQHESWAKSYSLMTNAFRLDGEVSGERLLNACKWFEEIPGTGPLDDMSSDHVNQICDAALAKAKDLGHADADFRGRITNSLKRVGKESRAAQVGRIVAEINSHFGANVLRDGIVGHVSKGLGPLRGAAAHSHLTTNSEEEFRTLSKSIFGLEALCWLLTAASLPLSEEAKARARSHAIVLTYVYSFDP